MTRFVTFLIKFYQKFKNLFLNSNSCRFYPSCSTYALQAIEKYGFWKGSFLFTLRFFKCSPFTTGGYDPLK